MGLRKLVSTSDESVNLKLMLNYQVEPIADVVLLISIFVHDVQQNIVRIRILEPFSHEKAVKQYLSAVRGIFPASFDLKGCKFLLPFPILDQNGSIDLAFDTISPCIEFLLNCHVLFEQNAMVVFRRP